VRRSAYKNYPIYQQKKRGGNLLETVLKHIEGDIAALRDELQTALQLGPKEVTVNKLTQHIVVRVCFYFLPFLPFLPFSPFSPLHRPLMLIWAGCRAFGTLLCLFFDT
jgi:large subunit ribosomal protein L49